MSKHGVDEFYLYDPESGALEGWLRGAAGLEEIADMNGHTSPRLGIRFEPGEGPDNLKIIGPDGRRFLTYVELFEDREAERTPKPSASAPKPSASAPKPSAARRR